MQSYALAALAGVALAGLAALAGATVLDLVGRPSLRRLALRNIARRPAEAALVVIGSMLGTAIISAAFIVGDTFDASIRDQARTELGPIDQAVRAQGSAQAAELEAAVGASPLPGTDGTLVMTWSQAAAASVAAQPSAEPATSIAEVDFDAARAFGGDPAATGFAAAGPTPGPGEAVLNEDLAHRLRVGVGDRIELYAFGSALGLAVREVLPTIGLAGYQGVYVQPGTIERLAAAVPAGFRAQPPTVEVLVSNEGGVFDGALRAGAVTAELERRVAGMGGVEVRPLKQSLLDEARANGAAMGQLFSTIGAFSVLVGVLLLVNLFVMLAEERKIELGMLRAVGLKRNHLMRSFGLEGAVYSVLAAALGGVVGIGVGAAIVAVSRRIIAAGEPDMRFVFAVEASSLLAGVGIGLAISLLTVWGASARIARLNVIRAIRELPEPSTDRTGPGKLVLAALGVLAGVVLSVGGIAAAAAAPTLVGPPVALLSAIPMARRFLGRRGAVVAGAGLSLAWAVGAFSIVPDAMGSPGIELFVVQGVLAVATAVALVSQADRAWSRLAGRAAGWRGGLAVRLALAYPLARTVRTGIQLAMFSLVVFTMTFMSVFSEIFGAQAGSFADDARGGADLFVDSNPANPVPVEQLEADPEIAAVVPLLRGFPQFSTSFQPTPTFWPLAGADSRLLELGPPSLGLIDPSFRSEREAWEAVLTDPSLAVAPEFLLHDGGGPPPHRVRPGDRLRVIDPISGAQRSLTVAAVADSDFVRHGVIVQRELAAALLGQRGVESRHLVAVASGEDPEAVAGRLSAELVRNGGEASTFLAEIEEELAEQSGFIGLMQGYLALGLVIGVAGLGVVMVRAVRERRRQIGMLRALGLSASSVRQAFLLEAAFIAAQGIVLGIGLGLLTSYQVLTLSATFGDQPLPFTVPWGALALLLLAPLAAAMAAAVLPAAQAAAIRPAVALRIAE